MQTAELGVWLGAIFSASGVVGTLLGGFIASQWLARNERAQMRMSGIALACVTPSFLVFLSVRGKYEALAALVPLMTAFSVFLGPAYALLQRLVSDEMRATTMAVVMLLVNLIGFGIGPQLVGILSDVLRPATGDDSLRYAMLAVSFVALWAAWHFWRVGRTIQQDLQEMNVDASCF
jgi:MFS family permease